MIQPHNIDPSYKSIETKCFNKFLSSCQEKNKSLEFFFKKNILIPSKVEAEQSKPNKNEKGQIEKWPAKILIITIYN